MEQNKSNNNSSGALAYVCAFIVFLGSVYGLLVAVGDEQHAQGEKYRQLNMGSK